MLFSIALVYFVTEFMNAVQKKDNPFVFSKWMFVGDLMAGPVLLLIMSVLMLTRRIPTTALAIAIAGYLFYVTGYRGIISIPSSYGVPALSFDALRLWFKAMPNNLILQTALATMTLVLGPLQLWRLQRMKQEKRLSSFIKNGPET